MSDSKTRIRWWHRLQGKPFGRNSLLWSVPWFGVAWFVINESNHFAEAVRIGRDQGYFVCGTSALGMEPAIPAIIAALMAIVGEFGIMALFGIPTAILIGCWMVGSMF